MSDKKILEKYILQFVKQNKIKKIWQTGPTVLLFSIVLSIIFSISALLGFSPWYPGIVILLCPLIILILLIHFKPVVLFEFLQELDQDISAGQSLCLFYEMLDSNNTDNIYYNILRDRNFKSLSQIKPESVYKIPLDTKKKIVLISIIPALVLSIYTFFNPFPVKYELASIDIQEAAVHLAVREDLEDMFSAEIDQLHQLHENLKDEKEDTAIIEDTINNLTRDITKQLSALRRDSLSALIEEKKIDPLQGFNLEKLMDNEFTPDDTRDFIIDLLSDESISEKQRSSIQKSYEDFVSESDNENTTSLGEDLLDSFAPETGGTADHIENSVSSLKDALEKLNPSLEKEDENNISGTQQGNRNQQQEIDRDSMDNSTPNNSSSYSAAGKEGNMSDNQDGFIPRESSGIEAHLPEGQIMIDSDKGILRLEADEEIDLERSRSIYDLTPFDEGIIRDYDIPDNMRILVKDYFTIIGGMTWEE